MYDSNIKIKLRSKGEAKPSKIMEDIQNGECSATRDWLGFASMWAIKIDSSDVALKIEAYCGSSDTTDIAVLGYDFHKQYGKDFAVTASIESDLPLTSKFYGKYKDVCGHVDEWHGIYFFAIGDDKWDELERRGMVSEGNEKLEMTFEELRKKMESETGVVPVYHGSDPKVDEIIGGIK